MPAIRLRIVTPVAAHDSSIISTSRLLQFLRPTTFLDAVGLDEGPATIETELDEALATPGTLRRVAEAAESGCDAIIIECVGDPGLPAARELVAVPVLGPGQTGIHVSSMLGSRFSILVARPRGIAPMRSLVSHYGFQDRLASVRAIGIPIDELGVVDHRSLDGLIAEAQLAIQDDGADVIMLGSTRMTGFAGPLSAHLVSDAVRTPVVDPLVSAVILAEGLVSARLSHHYVTSPVPDALFGRTRLGGTERLP
jgi:allantoin racemase